VADTHGQALVTRLALQFAHQRRHRGDGRPVLLRRRGDAPPQYHFGFAAQDDAFDFGAAYIDSDAHCANLP